jgi:hypothetical protein
MLRVQTWTHKQDVSIEAAPAVVGSVATWRDSEAESAAAGSAVASVVAWRGSAVARSPTTSWRGSTSWVTVRNYLSSMKGKVIDEVANIHKKC